MAGIILWTLIGFFLGSLPFSYWLARLLVRKDIREYGDGNPGGVNAWKAGGWPVGLLGMFFDVGKGIAPIVLARANGVSDWGLVPVALAPVIGHAFSPFLNFRGGKALAPSGGVWLGLIGAVAFLAYAPFALVSLALQTENAWTGIAGVAGLLVYSLVGLRSPYLSVIAVGHLALLIWKHRKELQRPINLRPWAATLLGRRQS